MTTVVILNDLDNEQVSMYRLSPDLTASGRSRLRDMTGDPVLASDENAQWLLWLLGHDAYNGSGDMLVRRGVWEARASVETTALSLCDTMATVYFVQVHTLSD